MSTQDSAFYDVIRSYKPSITRDFYIGGSDYSQFVTKWPSIGYTHNNLKPTSINVELSNADGDFNFFRLDKVKLITSGFIAIGAPEVQNDYQAYTLQTISQNFIRYSQSFIDSSFWFTGTPGFTIYPGSAVAPNGLSEATILYNPTSANPIGAFPGNHYQLTNVATGSNPLSYDNARQDLTMKIYLRTNSAPNINNATMYLGSYGITGNIGSGTLTATLTSPRGSLNSYSVFSCGSGWFLFCLSAKASTTREKCGVLFSNVASGASVDVWGFQVQSGIHINTYYYPTSSSPTNVYTLSVNTVQGPYVYSLSSVAKNRIPRSRNTFLVVNSLNTGAYDITSVPFFISSLGATNAVIVTSQNYTDPQNGSYGSVISFNSVTISTSLYWGLINIDPVGIHPNPANVRNSTPYLQDEWYNASIDIKPVDSSFHFVKLVADSYAHQFNIFSISDLGNWTSASSSTGYIQTQANSWVRIGIDFKISSRAWTLSLQPINPIIELAVNSGIYFFPVSADNRNKNIALFNLQVTRGTGFKDRNLTFDVYTYSTVIYNQKSYSVYADYEPYTHQIYIGSAYQKHIFDGQVTNVSYSRNKCTVQLTDKIKKLSERVIGDQSSPVFYTGSNYLPSDIAFWLLTSYGGFDTVASTTNLDIDYSSLLEWASIFSSSAVYINAIFEGEKVTAAIRKLGRMTDSAIYMRDNKITFKRFSSAASDAVPITNDYVLDVGLSVDDETIINKQYVYGDFDATSDYFKIIVYDAFTYSINSYGIREQIEKDESVYHISSATALDLAQRLTFINKDPYDSAQIKTSLGAMLHDIGDVVQVQDDSISMETSFRIVERKFNSDDGTITFKGVTNQLIGGFTLDVSSLNGNDRLV